MSETIKETKIEPEVGVRAASVSDGSTEGVMVVKRTVGPGKRPIGLEWRASYWFTTLVIGSGIAIDLMVYSIIIPVVPFQLEMLEYENVSSLAGWLLFAYSGGLLVSTFPIASFSERYEARRWPLIVGFVVLIGSQIMFMEAPNYAVMCVARVIQGIGSSIVWVIGLALLCDATPAHIVGQQLGLAMIGFSVGLMLGPPIGGALYSRFGFRGPFIFGVIFALADLLGRFVIIERKDALKWGHDPFTPSSSKCNTLQDKDVEDKLSTAGDADTVVGSAGVAAVKAGEEMEVKPPQKQLSFFEVMVVLAKSKRAVAASFIIFLYGVLYASQEPSIPVHLQDVWGLSSDRVGVVFIAAVVPTLFSTPLTGWISDKRGTEGVQIAVLLLCIPWFVVMTLESRLAIFVVAFGFSSFFSSGVISPVMAELAIVAQEKEGVGYAHVYGVFNAAYGVGSTIGPVIGGQMYDNMKDGFQVIVILAASLAGLGAVVSFCFIGDRPLMGRVLGLFRGSAPTKSNA